MGICFNVRDKAVFMTFCNLTWCDWTLNGMLIAESNYNQLLLTLYNI